MRIILLILSLFFIFPLFSQYLPEDYEDSDKRNRRRDRENMDTEISDFSTFSQKLTLWGDIDLLWFGSVFNFGIGPKLGYRFADNFMMGPGVRYLFIRNSFYNVNLNVLGMSFFGSWQPIPDRGFTIHAEYERLNLEYVQTNPNPLPGQPASYSIARTNANLFFLGLGVKYGMKQKFFYKYLVLYDVLGDLNAPYVSIIQNSTNPDRRNTLIFRISIGYNF